MGQRVIPVAVTAEYIGGDGVTLGAAGSHNSVVIEFDFRAAGPMWEPPAGGTLIKYVLWTNPQGNTTNRVNLGVDKLVPGYDNKVYHASPTADAMCVAGWAEMVVVGAVISDGNEVIKVKTEPSRFRVLQGSSRAADNEGIAATVEDQLQAEIETVDSRKVNKPLVPLDPDGTDGQFLVSRGNGLTEWMDFNEEIIEAVIEKHPEWTPIRDGAIITEKIADEAITTPKIASGAVTSGKLGDLSVIEDKIAYGAVTTDKLADNAVTANKLKDSSVPMSKLGSDVIGNLKLKDTRTAEIETEVQRLRAAVGTPLTASSASDMTDRKKIYVYTGDASGRYITGHWYYWSGAAWTDGGVYNSAAIETDVTLTVSGAAADAAAVGNRVDAIGTKTHNLLLVPDQEKQGCTIWEEDGALTIDAPDGLTMGTFANIALESAPDDVHYANPYVLLPAGTYRFLLAGLNRFVIPGGMYFEYSQYEDRTDSVSLSGQNDVTLTFPNNTYVWFHVGVEGKVYNSVRVQAMIARETDKDFLPPYTATDYKARQVTDRLDGKVSYLPIADLSNADRLANGTDYDFVTALGPHAVTSAARAATMIHCPVDFAHVLFVLRINPDAERFAQIIYGNSRRIVYRVGFPDTWGPWAELYVGGFPVATSYTKKIGSMARKLSTEGTAVYGTLPKNTGVIGETEYYNEGDQIPGVLYSSVWRDGLDVYRNLTLETYYSALGNPASVLYTKDYTSRNVYNAHTWYGGVCSTFVCYVIGMERYSATNALIDMLEDKQVESFDDVEAGDLLVKYDQDVNRGHIAIIGQVFVDASGALSAFAVYEQTQAGKGVFRSRSVSVDDFQDYIDSNGFVLKENPNADKLAPLSGTEYNREVIFERGNNTYVTYDDIVNGAWFYIPNAIEIYWKKQTGTSATEEYVEISLASMPRDTVNGVTVYNLRALFNGPGDYYFTHDIDSKPCLIRMIAIGTAALNLENGVTTLSMEGWSGCIPAHYYIVKETERTSPSQHYCMDPTEGYVADAINVSGDIDLSPSSISVEQVIPVEQVQGLDRYKLWLELDTGLGYKQVLTNIVTTD